ncbi:hypothetical protein [Nitrosomonas sp.]|nr:hypothetical protein [Nitrosomonas sp.]
MIEQLTTYDPVAALVDDEEIAFFMADFPLAFKFINLGNEL